QQKTIHIAKPWIRTAVDGFVRSVTETARGGFPCTFARAAIARQSLYFAFADCVHDPAELAAVRQSLTEYLAVCRTIPKTEEHLHVLLIFVAPSAHELSLQDYHAQAWNLMADWITNDTAQWPHAVPQDPHSPYWALCYQSVQLFVNVSCPAHKARP